MGVEKTMGSGGDREIDDSTSENAGARLRDWVALSFAMTLPAVMTFLEFVVLGGRMHEANLALQIAFGAGKLVQFSFPVLYMALNRRGRLRPVAPTWRDLWVGVAFGLLTSAAIWVLYPLLWHNTNLFESTPATVRTYLEEFHLDTPARYLLLAAFMSGLHSLLEEYYWRWFVFGGLRRHVPGSVAIVVSSLAFMAHHVIILVAYFPGNLAVALVFSLCVAVGGAVWAWLYARYQSLYAPWISHLLIDAAIMAVGYNIAFG
jgi:membrane protease YdiL (CAAX protease family)